MAAMTTEPCDRMYSWLSYTMGTLVDCLSAGMAKPCKEAPLLVFHVNGIFMIKMSSTISKKSGCELSFWTVSCCWDNSPKTVSCWDISTWTLPCWNISHLEPYLVEKYLTLNSILLLRYLTLNSTLLRDISPWTTSCWDIHVSTLELSLVVEIFHFELYIVDEIYLTSNTILLLRYISPWILSCCWDRCWSRPSSQTQGLCHADVWVLSSRKWPYWGPALPPTELRRLVIETLFLSLLSKEW